MLVSILLIFIICWIPRVMQSFITHLVIFIGIGFALNDKEMDQLSQSLRLFSYVNSIVNVFIYYITSK